MTGIGNFYFPYLRFLAKNIREACFDISLRSLYASQSQTDSLRWA